MGQQRSMAESDAPLVSISVTAYQHAPYLALCLESILMQDCPFRYEVLLGEDDSSDGTRAIAQRYAEAHPDRIRLFLHRRDQMMRIDGRPTGRFNFLNNLRHARGRYLCHLDGDDAWTDPQRLRRMVDRMEAEPDLSMAFHNAMNAWDDGREAPFLAASETKPRFTLPDLMLRNFVPTSGAIWRWEGPQAIPEALNAAPFGDWALNTHFALRGPIGYEDRCWSRRRIHLGGAMSTLDELGTMRGIALAYEVMLKQVRRPLVPGAVQRWSLQVVRGFEKALKAGDRDHARWFLKHAGAVPQGAITRRTRLRWWALLHWPRLMRAYARLRA